MRGHDRDRADAARWAAAHLDPPRANHYCILDTETTGLDVGAAEVIQIGVIDLSGRVLLDTLVYPTRGVPPEATAIHGLTRSDLRQAAPFPAVYQVLAAILTTARALVYNASFDRDILTGQCYEHRLPQLPGTDSTAGEYARYPRWEDIMTPYSAFVGAWLDAKGAYRWQKLPGGDHTAIGDCRAALAVLREMAGVATAGDVAGEEKS